MSPNPTPEQTTVSPSLGDIARAVLGGLGLGILFGGMILQHYAMILAGAIMMSTSATLITWKERQ